MKYLIVTWALLFFEPIFTTELNNLRDIPEAPVLPELNVNGLPKYIRSVITTERTDSEISQIVKRSDLDKNDIFVQTPQAPASNSQKERHTPRTYGLNLTAGDGYVWNDIHKNPGVYYEVGKSEDGENQPKLPLNEKTSKPTSFNNLLNDDQFWKWLTQWTEFYFDALTKKIEKQIEDEVAKQLSSRPHGGNQSDKSKIENIDKNSINININTQNKEESDVPKYVKIYINGKEIVTNTSGVTNIELSENNEINDNKNSSLKDVNENPINIILKSDAYENKNVHKHDAENIKILINGRDIATNASKLEHKDVGKNASGSEIIDLITKEQKYRSEKKEPSKVDGQIIYGNSIGNDKVTNIFILNPKENNDIVKELIYNITNNDQRTGLNVTENVSEREEKYIKINETIPVTDIDIRTGEE